MRQLGQLEAVVMQHVWDADHPLAVREVLEVLNHDRALAYTTVLTVLDNLHRKGFVTRSKVGRAFVYSASSSREEHTATLLSEVLADTEDRGAALLHFVGRLPAAEVAELRAALSQLETGA